MKILGFIYRDFALQYLRSHEQIDCIHTRHRILLFDDPTKMFARAPQTPERINELTAIVESSFVIGNTQLP